MRAFVPDPLPPVPPLRLDSQFQTTLEATGTAVGRPDAIGASLPDPSLSTNSHVRKEAVPSARIEGMRLLPTL